MAGRSGGCIQHLNNLAQPSAPRLRIAACGLAFIFACLPVVRAGTSEALWKAHVEPLLKEHCQECHNPTKSKSGLDLSSLQTMLRGGERGPAVVPGRPEESNLYKLLRSEADPHMPPGTRKPLGDEESALIAKWIQELPVVTVSATTNDSWRNGAGASDTAKRRITWKPAPGLAPENAVNTFLELAWKLDGVLASTRSSDERFVRRVYLDLAGRIPTASEARAFLEDSATEKRARLIESLLASDDYPRHMREIFDYVLMGRPTRRWEERRAKENWPGFLEAAFRKNRPWNEVVRDLVIARPESAAERGAVWFLYERDNNAQAIAEALAPVAFGVQIKCAQCHDHMIAREIKQAHYWGMVAAFNRSKNIDTPNGPALSESAIGGFVSFANLKKESQQARLVFFNGRNVDEPWPKDGESEKDTPELYTVPPPEKDAPKRAAVPKFSRRAALADAITRDNPLLARAMVNRVWAMLFGRGIVHPVDLMDSKHPPSHPELLDWLARDFEQSGYDVKRLVRILCNTRAYQLDSKPAATASAPAPESFARALDKPLSAEQLLRALIIATENQPNAQGKIGDRTEKELRAAFVQQFPSLFAPDYNATLQQAMFFSNSPLFDELLAPRPGNLSHRLIALPDDVARVRAAFAAVYGRAPDAEELSKCEKYLGGRSPEAGLKQLLWAMLTSAEFQLNH